jgi:hypothetical protein
MSGLSMHGVCKDNNGQQHWLVGSVVPRPRGPVHDQERRLRRAGLTGMPRGTFRLARRAERAERARRAGRIKRAERIKRNECAERLPHQGVVVGA